MQHILLLYKSNNITHSLCQTVESNPDSAKQAEKDTNG